MKMNKNYTDSVGMNRRMKGEKPDEKNDFIIGADGTIYDPSSPIVLRDDFIKKFVSNWAHGVIEEIVRYLERLEDYNLPTFLDKGQMITLGVPKRDAEDIICLYNEAEASCKQFAKMSSLGRELMKKFHECPQEIHEAYKSIYGSRRRNGGNE